MEAEQITARTGGSRFAATLGLLCQYMKDQGGLVPSSSDGGSSVAEKERTTMELFPQQAGSLKDPQERRGTERAQLTIFYGGRAMVFDDFPAERAKELMQLASSDAGAGAYQDAPGQPCWPDHLPVARKASLQRFLEKRKSRLAATDPYTVADSAPPAGAAKEAGKPVKDGGASWLGVNSMMLDLN